MSGLDELDALELRAELDAANEEIAKLACQLCDAIDASLASDDGAEFHLVAVRVLALRSWVSLRRSLRNRMRLGVAA